MQFVVPCSNFKGSLNVSDDDRLKSKICTLYYLKFPFWLSAPLPNFTICVSLSRLRYCKRSRWDPYITIDILMSFSDSDFNSDNCKLTKIFIWWLWLIWHHCGIWLKLQVHTWNLDKMSESEAFPAIFFYSDVWVMYESNLNCLSRISFVWVKSE